MDRPDQHSDPIAPAETAEERGPARATPRASLFLLAPLSTLNGQPLGKVRVRNLSAHGLMAECERPLAKGTRVKVELRGVGPVLGAVAWTAEHQTRIGIHFDEAIDPQLARKPVGGNGHIVMLPDYLRPVKRFGN